MRVGLYRVRGRLARLPAIAAERGATLFLGINRKAGGTPADPVGSVHDLYLRCLVVFTPVFFAVMLSAARFSLLPLPLIRVSSRSSRLSICATLVNRVALTRSQIWPAPPVGVSVKTGEAEP